MNAGHYCGFLLVQVLVPAYVAIDAARIEIHSDGFSEDLFGLIPAIVDRDLKFALIEVSTAGEENRKAVLEKFWSDKKRVSASFDVDVGTKISIFGFGDNNAAFRYWQTTISGAIIAPSAIPVGSLDSDRAAPVRIMRYE